MRVAGAWLGWGLGDHSSKDFTVRDAKRFMRGKFPSYAGTLADTNLFDQAMFDAVYEMQRRYNAAGKLHPPTGILDLDTQIVMGFRKPPPKVLPIIFTVEGHLSNMFAGPCAFVASTLEAQGVCHWQPVGYDCVSLPFRNQTGVAELVRLLSCDRLGPNNSWPFPDDLPWGLMGFSQGAIVTGKTWLQQLRPATGGRLAARRDHLRRAISFGDPYREKNVIAEWVPDPPKKGTQGISDVRMDNTPPWWKVHSRHGDLYSENPDDEVGLNRTAIYKIASENSWAGGPAALLNRILDAVTDPVDGVVDIALAILGGAMFLGRMESHGAYDLNPCIEHMRGVR